METQAPSLRRLLLPIVLTLAFLIVGVGAWRVYGGSLPFAAKDYRFKLPLPSAQNLNPGSDVQVSGVDVGSVRSIDIVDGHPVATIDMKARFAPVRSDAVAIPRTKSLLGEGYIEMSRGSKAAPAIPEGGSLPSGQVRSSQALDQFLTTFDSDARSDLRRLFAGTAAAFRGQSEAMSATLGDLAPTTGDFRSVLDTLDGQRDQLGTLVANAGVVFRTVGEREGDLQSAVIAGNRVLDTTAKRNRELRQTIAALPAFLTSVRNVSQTAVGASGDIDRAVSSLRPVIPEVRPALDAVYAAAPDFRQLFHELSPTLRAGIRGLPSIDRILSAIPPAFDQIYPTAREVIPTAALFKRIRRSLLSLFANVANAMNGTVIAPNGETITTVGGAPSIWNETLAGWVKRLPTARPNPYPKPNSPLDIAKGGLKSYDCRHTGNPNYLPATGGQGAPPCILQGPWRFRGKTAFYPRLRLAPK